MPSWSAQQTDSPASRTSWLAKIHCDSLQVRHFQSTATELMFPGMSYLLLLCLLSSSSWWQCHVKKHFFFWWQNRIYNQSSKVNEQKPVFLSTRGLVNNVHTNRRNMWLVVAADTTDKTRIKPKTLSPKTWMQPVLTTWHCWPAAGQSGLADCKLAKTLTSLCTLWQSKPNVELLLLVIHPLFCLSKQTKLPLRAFAHTIAFITNLRTWPIHTVLSSVLFIQGSPLSITVQVNCYTGLKITTFKWN